MRSILVILLMIASCSAPITDGSVPVNATPDPAPAPIAPPADPTERMLTHYQDVVQIRDAVIAGDLPGVRPPARRLRERTDPIPESWLPFVTAKDEHATIVLTARSLRVAARAAASLANDCGDCHEALGDGPRFGPPASPPAPIAHRPEQHMLRHQWAADRMWEALISRSDEAWTAGAEVLADAPLHRGEIAALIRVPDDILDLNERVHELGSRARTTAAWPARAEIYGDFLAACAKCHLGGY